MRPYGQQITQSYVEYILMTVFAVNGSENLYGVFIYGLSPQSAAAGSAECAWRTAVSAYYVITRLVELSWYITYTQMQWRPFILLWGNVAYNAQAIITITQRA